MLNLYRRHRSKCVAGHPWQSRSSDLDERKKTWKRCDCTITASGTLAGKFNRKDTERIEWGEARAVAEQWEKAGNWGDAPIILAAALPAISVADVPLASNRVTVENAIRLYKAEFEEFAAHATRKKYNALLKRVQEFSNARGYAAIDQWTVADVREFRAAWKVHPRTAANTMGNLRAFFEFCLSNGWISINPARLVKNPHTRKTRERRNEQKLPFSDDELQRMYDGCEGKYAAAHERKTKWGGQDLADFISVSIYTGLRISDVATFNIDRLMADGSIRLRTIKTDTDVSTWPPEWLQDRIRERARTIGPYIFGAHKTEILNSITEPWRRRLEKLWATCGPWKEKPTAHRFRHTFARILLEHGVSVPDVATLMGITEATVRKYYAAWIPERRDRLTNILKDAFAEKPKPNVVAMPKRG